MPTSDPDYQANYRRENPEYVARQNKRQKARNAAMRRLANKFQREFHELFTEELRKENAL